MRKHQKEHNLGNQGKKQNVSKNCRQLLNIVQYKIAAIFKLFNFFSGKGVFKNLG